MRKRNRSKPKRRLSRSNDALDVSPFCVLIQERRLMLVYVSP